MPPLSGSRRPGPPILHHEAEFCITLHKFHQIRDSCLPGESDPPGTSAPGAALPAGSGPGGVRRHTALNYAPLDLTAGESMRRLPDNVIVRGPGFWGLLGEADREALISAARSRAFPAGMMLCMEGEPTTHVFVLLSGWVKVITVTRDGREVLEALRGEGEVIGEIAGQVTGYRTATVQAIGTVRALIVGAPQFEDFLDTHPGAAHAHRQVMIERQRAANEQQRSLALLSGAQRLASLLLDLAEKQGVVGRNAATTPLPLSQEELASLIGVSRSTVTRALHEWRLRRIIGTDQRHIEILDRSRLLRIAGRLPKEPLSAHGRRLSRPRPLKNTDH
jgi:CRP/FNR family transcriptional regulator, cyclic AMP receptor protein